MVEVAYLARRAKLTIEETLIKLREAGVDSMPGGGAEIFAARVRSIICDHKIDGEEWLETARLAHKLGFKSNATMLYGHIENDEDRVDHLLKLRALQDETGGFQTFIPLAFHPENTPLDHLPVTTGLTDIRQIAVSRLLLDNFPHIKAYWQMMTPKIAQIALRFGADDLDGTVIEEKIYHDAGATTPQGMTPQGALPPDHRGRPGSGGARYAVPRGDAHRGQLYGRGLVEIGRRNERDGCFWTGRPAWTLLRIPVGNRVLAGDHVFHLPGRLPQGGQGLSQAGKAGAVHAGARKDPGSAVEKHELSAQKRRRPRRSERL